MPLCIEWRDWTDFCTNKRHHNSIDTIFFCFCEQKMYEKKRIIVLLPPQQQKETFSTKHWLVVARILFFRDQHHCCCVFAHLPWTRIHCLVILSIIVWFGRFSPFLFPILILHLIPSHCCCRQQFTKIDQHDYIFIIWFMEGSHITKRQTHSTSVTHAPCCTMSILIFFFASVVLLLALSPAVSISVSVNWCNKKNVRIIGCIALLTILRFLWYRFVAFLFVSFVYFLFTFQSQVCDDVATWKLCMSADIFFFFISH